jgi:hypothetical protein
MLTRRLLGEGAVEPTAAPPAPRPHRSGVRTSRRPVPAAVLGHSARKA